MRVLFGIVVTIVLMSCRKEITYEILIRNNTHYRLDKVHFSTRDDEKEPAVEPWGETKIYLNSKKRSDMFIRRAWDFGIRNYSDSLGGYDNTLGYSINLDQLKTGEMNVIVITLNPNPEYPKDPFDFSLND